ncbi:hypothetical protein V9N52_003711 [Vibrio navarrensis]
MKKCTHRTLNAQGQISFNSQLMVVGGWSQARFSFFSQVRYKNGVNITAYAAFKKQASYLTAPTDDMKECNTIHNTTDFERQFNQIALVLTDNAKVMKNKAKSINHHKQQTTENKEQRRYL